MNCWRTTHRYRSHSCPCPVKYGRICLSKSNGVEHCPRLTEHINRKMKSISTYYGHGITVEAISSQLSMNLRLSRSKSRKKIYCCHGYLGLEHVKQISMSRPTSSDIVHGIWEQTCVVLHVFWFNLSVSDVCHFSLLQQQHHFTTFTKNCQIFEPAKRIRNCAR